MDGYAVRAQDVTHTPVTLPCIGVSAAGHGYDGTLHAQSCVRIFTGAPVPEGADVVIIQENTSRSGDEVTFLHAETTGRNIRPAGLDFRENDELLPHGVVIGACELALAAAMNYDTIPVHKKPCVALLATGDELIAPGGVLKRDQIIASNTYAVAAYARQAGADILDLGIAPDRLTDIEAAIRKARDAKADVLVTLGGASVGDHDLVQQALKNTDMELGFWRIAMRPGKPLMHGKIGTMQVLGLPGNPVSAIVCAVLFLVPLIRKLSGQSAPDRDRSHGAILGADLRENDSRQDYIRASLHYSEEGLIATPFSAQDSSMLRVLAQSSALIIRPPHAPAASKGSACRILRLDQV
jgi:molybdopterin molybdotransferase